MVVGNEVGIERHVHVVFSVKERVKIEEALGFFLSHLRLTLSHET